MFEITHNLQYYNRSMTLKMYADSVIATAKKQKRLFSLIDNIKKSIPTNIQISKIHKNNIK